MEFALYSAFLSPHHNRSPRHKFKLVALWGGGFLSVPYSPSSNQWTELQTGVHSFAYPGRPGYFLSSCCHFC